MAPRRRCRAWMQGLVAWQHGLRFRSCLPLWPRYPRSCWNRATRLSPGGWSLRSRIGSSGSCSRSSWLCCSPWFRPGRGGCVCRHAGVEPMSDVRTDLPAPWLFRTVQDRRDTPSNEPAPQDPAQAHWRGSTARFAGHESERLEVAAAGHHPAVPSASVEERTWVARASKAVVADAPGGLEGPYLCTRRRRDGHHGVAFHSAGVPHHTAIPGRCSGNGYG